MSYHAEAWPERYLSGDEGRHRRVSSRDNLRALRVGRLILVQLSVLLAAIGASAFYDVYQQYGLDGGAVLTIEAGLLLFSGFAAAAAAILLLSALIISARRRPRPREVDDFGPGDPSQQSR